MVGSGDRLGATVKAVVIRASGRPDGLAVVDLPAPAPAAGQVLVATEAIGVGGVDAVIRSGALAAYDFQPDAVSRRPADREGPS